MIPEKTQRTKINFKIKASEIGKYSTTGITLNDVPNGFIDKFSEKEIEKAKELKAKQTALYNEDPTHRNAPDYYSDSYYLDMARSICTQEEMGRVREVTKRTASRCQITDVYWAQFSYEEIIQMEQDGYDIPKEVIEWAHSQQQADVTDYIILSDNAETDDASSTDDTTGADEINKHRAQSLNDIAKVEKAEKETEQHIEAYKETKSKAKSIHAKNKFFKDLEFKKIESMTQEWKKLNEKKQSGKLNSFEKARFSKLSKELKESGHGALSKLEDNAEELNEFLQNLDSLGKKIEKNDEVVTETIQHARNLAEMEKQYAPSLLPVATKGIIVDGNGLSTSTLYGIKVEDISRVAIIKSKDLGELDKSTQNHIESDKVQKLANFATEYNDKVTKVTQETKNVVGDDEQKDSKDDKDKKDKPNFKVEKVFSAANSVVATATTIAATEEMISKQKSSKQKEKELNKEVKKSETDLKALQQEVNSVEAERLANLSEEERFLTELDKLNEQDDVAPAQETQAPARQTAAPQVNVQQTAAVAESGENKSPEQEQEVQPVENNNQDDKAQERADILDRLGLVKSKDNPLVSRIVKASEKSKASTFKSKIFANILRNETTTFEQARKTTQKVATDTAVVGVGTTTLGYTNTIIAGTLIGAAQVMLASIYPPTVVAGLKLMATGTSLLHLGTAEIVTGILATGTGITTTEYASSLRSETAENNASEKAAQNTVKANQADIEEAERATGIETEVNVEAPQGVPAAQTTAQPAIQESQVAEVMNTVEAETDEMTLQEQPDVSAQTPNTLADVSARTTEANATALPQVTENGKPENNAQTENLQKTNDVGKTPELKEENAEKDDVKGEKTKASTSSDNNVSEADVLNISQNKEINNTPKDEQAENGTEQDSKTEQRNNNADDRTNKDKQEASKTYDVAMVFGVAGSLNAINTTIKATQDANSAAVAAGVKEDFLSTRIAKLTKLKQNADTDEKKAETETKIVINKAEQTKAQIEAETANIQKAAEQYDEQSLVASQDNVENLTAQLAEFDNKGLGKLNTDINSVNTEVQASQKEHSDLNNEISKFNDVLTAQHKASKDTIAVGGGTYAVGLVNMAEGIGLFTGGQALVASAGLNPVQHAIGLSMMSNGQILWGYGTAEQAAGIGAMAEGANGVNVNASLQSKKAENEEASIEGKAFLSVTRGEMSGKAQTAQDIAKGETEIIDDVNIISASASANANSAEFAETDDKADKKLARFNKETEIESRRKRRRVIAVSASTRG